jgi:hypothetical protein
VSRRRLRGLAALDEQVEVAEHLRQRQVGLRHRDVAPHLLSDGVGGQRPGVGEQAPDLACSPLVHAKAVVDELADAVTGSPWPGSTTSTSSIARVARIDAM